MISPSASATHENMKITLFLAEQNEIQSNARLDGRGKAPNIVSETGGKAETNSASRNTLLLREKSFKMRQVLRKPGKSARATFFSQMLGANKCNLPQLAKFATYNFPRVVTPPTVNTCWEYWQSLTRLSWSLSFY